MPLFQKIMSSRALLAVALLPVIFGSNNAFAIGYVGLDGSSIGVQNSLDDDLNPRGFRLRLGMPIAHLLDAEIHFGGGQDSETFVADKFKAYYMGAFLKGHLPVGRRSALFGLAGYSSVEFTQSNKARDFIDERSGFSYGFGLETEITRRMDLSADYVRYLRDEGSYSGVSAVSLGVKLYF
ncbi:porin family protein [Granulosicoccus antarcticus]|uniref:Outer membrane protein beta-barrel domain-containing protein n=1 Tax=Granulosicoccus antarcticus IMCC3135 TaxID=1192854 RepID=A0A2Z2NNP9_9GAMM|nr:porin family protein [Granulosicoccus antarcticus]ASJ72155.1 hypothetical protein IMCC3135_10305 [Granulosicoccus antarcticus IMCC3135]